jgi:hypothetical protein
MKPITGMTIVVQKIALRCPARNYARDHRVNADAGGAPQKAGKPEDRRETHIKASPRREGTD